MQQTMQQTPGVVTTSPMAQRFRDSFPIFGTMALLFGICFTTCFYRAQIGISYPIFILLAIALIQLVAGYLRQLRNNENFSFSQAFRVQRFVWLYYIPAILISISVVITAKPILQLFASGAILVLLEVAFLELLYYDRKQNRSFGKRLGELFLLPMNALCNSITAWIDSFSFLRKSRIFRNEKLRSILLGVAIAVPLLVLVLALLSSADIIFSSLTKVALNRIFFSADPYVMILLVLLIFAFCYGIITTAVYLMDREQREATLLYSAQSKKRWDPLTTFTVVSLLTFVYLLFSGIQFRYLLGGNLGLPKGFTYAEYVHQGFYQLLAVTVLNIAILIFCRELAGKSKGLRVILTVFTACTYVMIASAAFRMAMYISAYGLSFLRILVLWFLMLNTLFVSGIIVAIYKEGFPMFRYFVLVSAFCFILLAYSNPDARIAEYNLSSEEALRDADVNYLSKLSSDAAGVLLPVLAQLRGVKTDGTALLREELLDSERKAEIIDALDSYVRKIARGFENTDFRSFHFSKNRAKQLTKEYGLEDISKSAGSGIQFLNCSSASVYSVVISNEMETQGVTNADNTPLQDGQTFEFDMDFACHGEECTVDVYGRNNEVIASSCFSAPQDRKESLRLILWDSPDGTGFYIEQAYPGSYSDTGI